MIKNGSTSNIMEIAENADTEKGKAIHCYLKKLAAAQIATLWLKKHFPFKNNE